MFINLAHDNKGIFFFPFNQDKKKILNYIYFILVADEESLLTGASEIDPNQQAYDVGELISFASFDIPIDTNLQGQTTDVSDFKMKTKFL